MKPNMLVAGIVAVLSLTGFSSAAHASIIVRDAVPTSEGVIIRDAILKGANYLIYRPYATPANLSVQGEGVIIHE